MCVENLENDHNMQDQSGSYDNYQGDNYEHHQGVNNDKLVKNKYVVKNLKITIMIFTIQTMMAILIMII